MTYHLHLRPGGLQVCFFSYRSRIKFWFNLAYSSLSPSLSPSGFSTLSVCLLLCLSVSLYAFLSFCLTLSLRSTYTLLIRMIIFQKLDIKIHCTSNTAPVVKDTFDNDPTSFFCLWHDPKKSIVGLAT